MENYSNRALELIKTQKFSLTRKNKEQLNSYAPEGVFRCRVEIINNDLVEISGAVDEAGCLNKVYYQTNLTEVDLGFLEALFHLLQGKKRRELLQLSMREVENFMRDVNHLPAYPPEQAPKEEIWRVIDGIIKAVNKSFATNELIGMNGDYQQLSLVDRIKATEAVFDKAVRPALMQDGGDIQLVNIVDDKVFVSFQGNCVDCPSSQGATLEFVSEAVKKHLCDSLVLTVVMPTG